MTTSEPPPIALPNEVTVVNIGLPLFAEAVQAQGRPAVQVEWAVPAGGDPELVAALTRLYGRHARPIETANAEVLRRLDTGRPLLTAIRPAGDALPDLEDRTLLHCGPAITWDAACDPLRRSLRAATVAEGWAADVAGAHRLLEDGAVRLRPASSAATVVPMATAIGRSAPVFVVEDEVSGLRAHAPLNQGPGEVAWFGRETPAAIARLELLRDVAGPLLGSVIERAGPLDVLALAAQGLEMGDDVHLRTQAATNLLARQLLPQLLELASPDAAALGSFLAGNHLFFLNLAMAAAKALTLWAEQVDGASIVTAMGRNGTTFGVRLAGAPEWHVAAAPPVLHALYHPGQGPETSAPDIGDSAVLELVGLGGAAAAGSPAVAAFLGGTMADALRATDEMAAICAGTSSRFRMPALDHRPTPLGIDVRRVVERSITPKVTTGILHASAGTGQVGAGVAEAPLACFQEALLALDRRLA